MNILSTQERTNLAGDMDSVFYTLSQGRTLTVVKEPIKTLVAPANNVNLFGFGPNQAQAVYTNTPVSQTFAAILKYPNEGNPSPLSPEINVRMDTRHLTAKVQQDCRDYILNGVTLHFTIDDGNKTFLIDGDITRQMFLNETYYLVPLKESP